MKISNFKIMLLLVLGAFTLTLPNTARAEELSKGHQAVLDLGLRDGTITKANEVDISEHNKKRNEKIQDLNKLELEFSGKWYNPFGGIKGELFADTLKDKDLMFDVSGAIDWLSAVTWTNILDWGEEDVARQKQATEKIRDIYMGYLNTLETENPSCTGTTDKKECKDYYARKDVLLNKRIKNLEQFDSIVDRLIPIKLELKSLGKIGKETYIYIDPKSGDKVYFEKDGDTLTTVSGITIGCIPLPVKLTEVKSCIFCPLFKTIFNASQAVSTNSFNVLGQAMASVMLIGFALFVAFSVMKMVSGFTKQDAPKFITSLLSQTFKVLFAYTLLMKSGEIYEYVIAPVLAAGLEFGMSLLFEKGNEYVNSCKSSTGNVSNGILPYYLFQKLDCFIRAVQAEISKPQAIGSTLMCVARNASATEIISVKLWDFSMMFQGLIIFCFAWLISLAFAFYLIDATVRLGIVGALMPFLIACWPFKITSSYTSKGWEMFMNSFFTFVMMGLVVSINIQLMGQALTGSKGGFDEIQSALNANSIDVLRKLLDIGFSGFLILIACCIFGFKLTGQATELAGTMAGGGGSNIGAGIGGLAASGAKAVGGAAIKAGKGTVSTIGQVSGATAGLNKMKSSAVNGLSRGASKLFGVGKSSGAAGGGGKSTPTTPKSQQPTPGATPQSTQQPKGATPPPSAQQTQKAEEAAPRNSGNGSGNPAMRQDVQSSMREADKNVHNYAGNKQENSAAWDKYQKSETSLNQSKSEHENAQKLANNAKGTPDEAKYAALADAAAAKYAGTQKSHSQNEQNVQSSQDKMNNSAVNAYVNQQKAIAQRNGKPFDETASRNYAKSHLDEIKQNLDAIIKSDPKYN